MKKFSEMTWGEIYDCDLGFEELTNQDLKHMIDALPTPSAVYDYDEGAYFYYEDDGEKVACYDSTNEFLEEILKRIGLNVDYKRDDFDTAALLKVARFAL